MALDRSRRYPAVAFGGTYLSLWNVINIDLKKAGTWKELYERGEQAKKEKSKE